jgi:hypothetical protein
MIMDHYYFFTICLFVIVSYLSSLYFVKIQKINLITHRRVWNYLLLSSFLISGVLGLILAFFIDHKLSLTWYVPFLWLHVEFGIVMALISLFHILWHAKYFFRLSK